MTRKCKTWSSRSGHRSLAGVRWARRQGPGAPVAMREKPAQWALVMSGRRGPEYLAGRAAQVPAGPGGPCLRWTPEASRSAWPEHGVTIPARST